MSGKDEMTISASRFRERCLAILETLDDEGIVITKHGRPIARLLPIRQDSAGLIGALKDRVAIKGDILSTGIEWDAEP